MPSTAPFSIQHRDAGVLFRRWRLTSAYRVSQRLVSDFPHQADAYTLHNLAICLTNRGLGGLRQASPALIEQARDNIPDLPDRVYGDMLRDQLLGLVRFGHIEGYLAAARALPDQIEQFHTADPNRMACLTDAKARLAAAEGNPVMACRLHEIAHDEWKALGASQADQNWVHFNLVQWLRSAVAAYGRQSPQAQRVIELLAGQKPPGAHRDMQLRIVSLPWIGLGAYHWLETHR